MLLTNHTLTGVAIGLATGQPWLALPAGVVSHLLLDMTPHFGIDFGENWARHPGFIVLGGLDFAASAAVAGAAVWLWPQHASTVLAGVIGADLPDFTYIPLVLFGQANVVRRVPGYGRMLKFLADIQWYEKPPGAITEALWGGLMLWVLHGWLA